jgi:RNA recognition motif-containing protein
MSDIEPWMNEEIIMKSFKAYGFQPKSVKMIKDRKLNKIRNYCFINFDNIIEANRTLIQLNGKNLPNSNIKFKLNWANLNSRENPNVYVGNLSPEIDDIELYTLFKERYPSVHHASIITDKGISKGFGFVHFLEKKDYEKCLKEMDGFIFHNKAIKVKERKKKNINVEEINTKNNHKNSNCKINDLNINLINNNTKVDNNNQNFNINNICNYIYYNSSYFNMNPINQIENIKFNNIYSFYSNNRREEESSFTDNESTFSSQEKVQDLSLSNSNSNSNFINQQKRIFINNLEILERDDQTELFKNIQENIDKMFDNYKYCKNNESK